MFTKKSLFVAIMLIMAILFTGTLTAKSQEWTLPELEPSMSADGDTIYNAAPLGIVVANPSPQWPGDVVSGAILQDAANSLDLDQPSRVRYASFVVQYKFAGESDFTGQTCMLFPAEARTTFETALAYIARKITSNVPITIDACWAGLPSANTLGYAGGEPQHRNFAGAPVADTYYKASLANSLAGEDLDPSAPDINITFNNDFNWYFGNDPNVPEGSYSFISVSQHEIIHGLNFSGSAGYSNGIGDFGGSLGQGNPNIYDTFMEDGAGSKLISYPIPSAALGTLLTSNNLWFNGPTQQTWTGERVKIYAPDPWNPGSSYSHLDYATYSGWNKMMRFSFDPGPSGFINYMGNVTIGVLQDIGWQTPLDPNVEWTHCANEWEICSFTGTKYVYFGVVAEGEFFVDIVTDGISCDVGTWGDPIVGVTPKECFYGDVPDTTPPTTTINSNPAAINNSTSATFTFSGTDDVTSPENMRFQCYLDSGPWVNCSTPRTYTGLSDGAHSFWVKAADEAGNFDTVTAYYGWIVDTILPDTTIDSNPTDPTGSTSATFTFSGTDNVTSPGNFTFYCLLDSAPVWEYCTSPITYTGLSTGVHTFYVWAYDEAYNVDSSAAVYTWTINTTADTTPPDTTLDSYPANPTSSTSAIFTFSGTDNVTSPANLTFQCYLDSGPWEPCTSPQTYEGLSEGLHQFWVYAVDEANNEDYPDTVYYSWTVNASGPDTTPPETTLDSYPANPTSNTSATFTFSGTDNVTLPANLTFKCKLDLEDWYTCVGSQTFSLLGDGDHQFMVYAIDEAGNEGPAASYSWVIDTMAPVVTIDFFPSNPSNTASVDFYFFTDGTATYECDLDGGGYSACTSPKSYTGLSNGSHTFSVRATDSEGITGTPTMYTWIVNVESDNTLVYLPGIFRNTP